MATIRPAITDAIPPEIWWMAAPTEIDLVRFG